MKDKMHETPAFSVEFAKLALLTNVGRINTTMACEDVSFASDDFLFFDVCCNDYFAPSVSPFSLNDSLMDDDIAQSFRR